MRIIAITGADGSGKSTQIELLKTKLRAMSGLRVEFASIWDSMSAFHHVSQRDLAVVLDGFLLEFSSQARTYFLASVLRNSLDRIDSHSTDLLIFDGYIYKYWASEMAYGVDSKLWEVLAKQFPRPDQIFHLHVSLEECAQRKKKWSAYESGFGRFAEGAQLDSNAFRAKTHLLQKELVKSLGAKMIDGEGPAEEVFQRLMNTLGNYLGTQRRPLEAHP